MSMTTANSASSAAPIAVYLWAGGEITQNVTTGNFYFHDGRRNVTHLINSSNTVVERYTYFVSGQPTYLNGNATNNRFLFQGALYVPEAESYDMRNRFYHPNLGRFMQSDPIGFDAGDMNLFRYCGNDPVNGSDPLGLYYTVASNGLDDYTVRIPIAYKGAAATPPVVARFNEGIRSLSGSYPKQSSGGNYKLTFEPYTPTNPLARTNTVQVIPGKGLGRFGSEKGSDYAQWHAEGAENIYGVNVTPQQGARHSVGHFLTFKDRYNPATGKTEPGYEGNLMDYHPPYNPNSDQVEAIVHPGVGRRIANFLGQSLLGSTSGSSYDVRWDPNSGTGNWQADQYTKSYLLGGGENAGEGVHPAGPR